MDLDPNDARDQSTPRLGWKAVAITAIFYLVCVSIATWPRIAWLWSTLPALTDPLQHLWVMKWYKTCLLEGRSVFVCPEIQHPIGAPLGNFSSLHMQALLYFPLSLASSNDVLCYNLIWLVGLLMTGLGTYLLIWHVLGDKACAAFGGMLAMLSTPMMIHARGHLELIYVGGFPLFLVAWMRFVDRPNWRRMALAALGYLVVAMCAAYFLVFAIFPAALYVVCQSLGAGVRETRRWLRARTPWFLGFAALVLPGLFVLFSSQFWALAHGHSLYRPRAEFNSYGAPLWSYLTPTSWHLLGSLLPFDPYAALGETAGERMTYLGVVTVALMAYAAIHRVTFRNARYMWLAFLLLVALSLGASWQFGTFRISLPSEWLWNHFPVYRMTRVPARFGLFVGVIAGVLAAAGLRHLLARLPGRVLRMAVFGGLTAAAVADLALSCFWAEPVPAIPGCYAFLKHRDPKAAIVEIPHQGSGGSVLNCRCTYWQSLHRLTTSAGFSGHANAVEDNRMQYNSPFLAGRLENPDYLDDPAKMIFDINVLVDFRDYLWLYLTVNRFDYIVLHQRQGAVPEHHVRLDRLKALLQTFKVYEDEASIVYARSLIPPPVGPVHICLEDWRERNLWEGRWNCLIPTTARIMVYNPDPNRDLGLILDAATPWPDVSVCLRAGTTLLARWEVAPMRYEHCNSPPFRLPVGLQELTLVSTHAGQNLAAAKTRTRVSKNPCLLRVGRVSLFQAPDTAPIVARDHEDPPRQPIAR